MTLDDLLALAGASLEAVSAATGADVAARESVRGYQSLKHVDLIEAPDGTAIYLRGDEVALIYAGPDSLPASVDDAALREATGSSGTELDSRQGKSAVLHVVADKGVAWSEDGGEVGFIEVFPPTTVKEYEKHIYRRPGRFIR